MAYGDFNDLSKRTTAGKILRDKALNIANPKYDRYQNGLASMVFKFFHKKSPNANKGTGTVYESKHPLDLATW